MQKAGASTTLYHEMLQREQLPLPYSEYTEDGIFIMDNDGLAVIFECAAYGGYNAEAGLITALSALPEHAAMQFLMIPSRNLTNKIDRWKANKTATEELYQVTKNDFAAFVEDKATELISNSMRCLAAEYKLIISVIIGGRKKEYSVFKSIFDIFNGKVKKIDEDDMEKSYKVILDIKNKMEAALKTANLFPVLMTPDILIDNIFCLLNPNHDFHNIPQWEGNLQDMSDYMVANDNIFTVESDYISFDGMCGKSLSIKEYPKYWHCSMADQLIGAPFGSQSLESTVYICLNVINVGKEGINKTKRKSQVILSQNLNPHIFPRLNFKKIDLADASKQLELGEQLYHINLAIFPIAKDYDALQNVCSQVKSYYQGLGFKLEEDKFINLPIFLSMLPGNYDERQSSFSKKCC